MGVAIIWGPPKFGGHSHDLGGLSPPRAQRGTATAAGADAVAMVTACRQAADYLVVVLCRCQFSQLTFRRQIQVRTLTPRPHTVHTLSLVLYSCILYQYNQTVVVVDLITVTSCNQPLDVEGPTRLVNYSTSFMKLHYESDVVVTRHRGNQRLTACNRRPTLVRKSWLWLTQLHAYRPNMAM